MINKPKCITVFILSIFISLCGCHNDTLDKRLVGKDFDREGVFINDSIPAGKIKYFLHGTDNLVALQDYSNGHRNGASYNYFNTRIVQKATYQNDMQEGFNEIYDSTQGYLKDKEYYWHGKLMGPSYVYNSKGLVVDFEFRDFENRTIYSASYNNILQKYEYDDFGKLTSINVRSVLLNHKKVPLLFVYLIEPPGLKVIYQVGFFDQKDQMVDSFQIPNTNTVFWEGFIHKPDPNLNAGLVVNVYDSVLRKSNVFVTYLISKSGKE